MTKKSLTIVSSETPEQKGFNPAGYEVYTETHPIDSLPIIFELLDPKTALCIQNKPCNIKVEIDVKKTIRRKLIYDLNRKIKKQQY